MDVLRPLCARGMGIRAALGVLLFVVAGFFATATQAYTYPQQTVPYPAPWLEVFNTDPVTGAYLCVGSDEGSVEACTSGVETGHNWVFGTGWFSTSCVPYAQLNAGVCLQANWNSVPSNPPTPGAHSYTVEGQGCLYGGTSNTAGGLSVPGWCIFPYNAERNGGNPPPPAKQGDPINISVGNLYKTDIDYKGSGPFPLVFTRSYNSILALETTSPGNATENYGKGWTSNVGSHLSIISGAGAWPMALCQEPNSPFRYYICPIGGYTGASSLKITVWHADGGSAVYDYPGTSAADGTPLNPDQNSTGQLFFVSTLPSPATGGGFKYLRDDGYSEYYDSTGKLVSVFDKNGLQQVYAYNASNQVASITDPAGRTLSFTYDTSGRLQTMTDPASRVYTYTYDTHNNLSTVNYPDNTLPGGVTLTYKYEIASKANALTGVVDENGNRYLTWGYDTAGHATSSYFGVSTAKIDSYTFTYTTNSSGKVTSVAVVEPAGLHRTLTIDTGYFVNHLTGATAKCSECGDDNSALTYDANGYVNSATDFNGHVTDYVHDATGLETSRTEAYGTAYARTITTTWDTSLRQPTLITEPGRTTAYTYDTVGHVLTKTVTDTATSVARTTTYTYNTFGLLDTVDGSRTDVSDVTTYGYTTGGDRNSITDALGHVTQITAFDADGKPTTIVDPNGVTTTLAYDARQRLISKTVNTTEVTTYTYDNAGELTRVTLPDGSYLQYGYDLGHRVTSVTDNLGNKVAYTLDSEGNRITEQTKNPTGTVTRTMSRVYDSLERLEKTIGGLSQTTVYGYDSLNNIISITDPMLHATAQTYDPLNRLETSTDAYSGVTTYDQDALDHIVDITDPRGLNTHYDYDAFGDVVELDSPDTGTTTYTYDLAGNRLTKTNNASITATYTYDELNRLTSISYPDTSKNVTYTYDSGTYGKGHITGVADASGTTAYTYDAWGNLIQKVVVEGGQTFTVAYGYDLANRLAGITYPSGMAMSYTRDSTGQITAVTENSNTVASSIIYKPFGPISGLTYGNGLVETRTYDLDYRLTGISIPTIQGLTFGYNANDDITSITDSISASNTQTLGYDNLNRLTSAASGTGGYGSLTYAYDADGNRTSLVNGVGTATYTIDTLSNQLQSISGATTASYSYNAIGALDDDGANQYTYADTERLDTVTDITTSAVVATYVYNGLGQRTAKITSAGTSLFVYDESGHLLGEYDGSGSLIQEHVWLNDRPIGVINSAALYYVQTDQLDTPRIITDGSHAATWNWRSDPFGNGASAGILTYNLRFPGQYFDTETGHNYNQMRDYDANIGRYIESDPIGLQGGMNTFAYGLENPITRYDSLGLAGEEVVNAIDRFLKRGPYAPACEKPPHDPFCDEKEAALKQMRANLIAWTISGSMTRGDYNQAALGFNAELEIFKASCPQIDVKPLPIPFQAVGMPPPAGSPPPNPPPPG